MQKKPVKNRMGFLQILTIFYLVFALFYLKFFYSAITKEIISPSEWFGSLKLLVLSFIALPVFSMMSLLLFKVSSKLSDLKHLLIILALAFLILSFPVLNVRLLLHIAKSKSPEIAAIVQERKTSEVQMEKENNETEKTFSCIKNAADIAFRQTQKIVRTYQAPNGQKLYILENGWVIDIFDGLGYETHVDGRSYQQNLRSGYDAVMVDLIKQPVNLRYSESLGATLITKITTTSKNPYEQAYTPAGLPTFNLCGWVIGTINPEMTLTPDVKDQMIQKAYNGKAHLLDCQGQDQRLCALTGEKNLRQRSGCIVPLWHAGKYAGDDYRFNTLDKQTCWSSLQNDMQKMCREHSLPQQPITSNIAITVKNADHTWVVDQDERLENIPCAAKLN